MLSISADGINIHEGFVVGIRNGVERTRALHNSERVRNFPRAQRGVQPESGDPAKDGSKEGFHIYGVHGRIHV